MLNAVDGRPNSAEQRKLRATQSLIGYMGFCKRHPSLTLIEIAWRWLFGVPFLFVAWAQAQKILALVPLSSVGWDRMGLQSPWISSVLLAQAVSRYQPLVGAVLYWLVPMGVVGWAIVSGTGRMLVLLRMQAIDPIAGHSGRPFLRRLPGYASLQGLWMLALLGCYWLWYHAVGWASAGYVTAGAQPDLVGYLCWLIFFLLGFYTLWALLSWTLAIAPVLLFLDDARPGAPIRALMHSFSLGKTLSSKLMEVGLVLAIVRIMLIVLAMVLAAAPLPFADEFGPQSLHVVYVVVAVLFLMANDYFHVVRLRSFVALWRHYRGENDTRRIEFASDARISRYSNLQEEFAWQILEIKGWFVSDESSLWDFTMEDTLERSYAKIRNVYGVDVSDIEGALIWKILKRISERAGPIS
jgi:hypothetical protein